MQNSTASAFTNSSTHPEKLWTHAFILTGERQNGALKSFFEDGTERTHSIYAPVVFAMAGAHKPPERYCMVAVRAINYQPEEGPL